MSQGVFLSCSRAAREKANVCVKVRKWIINQPAFALMSMHAPTARVIRHFCTRGTLWAKCKVLEDNCCNLLLLQCRYLLG